MYGNVPWDVIVYAAIALVLVFKLKGLLGKNIGHVQKFDLEPKANTNDNNEVAPKTKLGKKAKSEDHADQEEDDAPPPYLSDKALIPVLGEISRLDNEFNAVDFIDKTGQAFSMVFEAFGEGDRETLEMLLDDTVYAGFSAALDEREQSGYESRDALISLTNQQITDANLNGSEATITVKFETEQIHALYDSEEQLLEGSPNVPNKIVESWTFARDLASRNPIWIVIATHNDVES